MCERVPPLRRDVRRLVEIMMGGDRTGQVGYDALPPLARDVHDRLAPLNLKLQQRGVQRALLDMASRPGLERCSDVLWMLRYLLPPGAARPIMGERRLGERPIQESWDLALGTHQRALIELGYAGVSVEQVLEQRLRREAYGPHATAASVLRVVEDATLYLRSRRLAGELGTRALEVLAAERSADGSPRCSRQLARWPWRHGSLAEQLVRVCDTPSDSAPWRRHRGGEALVPGKLAVAGGAGRSSCTAWRSSPLAW